MIESTINAENTVMDGSFYQPLESTRLTRSTANWSPNESSFQSKKTVPSLTKPEQQLYKVYAQSFADSELTQDWQSWIEEMKINCQKSCGQLELSLPTNFRSARNSQSNRTMNMLQNEHQMWLLLHLAREATNNTIENLPDVIPLSSDRLIVEHYFSSKAELRMAKAVQIWLQTIKATENYQNDLKISIAKLQKKRFFWEKTYIRLKQKYNSTLSNVHVTCLDFDAPTREKRQLYESDQAEEHDLLQTVFFLLRIGENSKAKNLCRSTGYHWLAAIIYSNEPYHDENYYCSENSESIYPVEGNRKRIEWIETMFNLCMDSRLSLYERAIYGFLCGRIEALLPVCKTYNDFLWAHVSCYIEQEIHSVLLSSKRDSSTDMIDEPIRTGRDLNLKSIFDLIPTCSTEISNEASLPFHQIEKLIILADYQTLFNNLPKFIINQDINGSFLRFATHISLFLFQHNNLNQFSEQIYVDTLSTYIQHLIELEFKDLVCYYISKLPDEYRSPMMAKFIDSLTNQQEKQFYLNQGFTFKIDIDKSLLILADNQKTDQLFQQNQTTEIISSQDKPLNEHDLKQLEALKLLTTFLSTQTLDALRFANRLCRYFLHESKYHGIEQALSYFPHDIDIYTIEANNREQSVDDLREFKSFAVYFAAIQSIQRWSEYHQKGVRAGFESTDKSESTNYLKVVIKACYAVFDYPHGWLIDTTAIHQQLPDYQQRANEMSIVRQKSIPVLACQIFRIFDLVKEDQEIFRLIVFLSDHREQQLYRLFPKDALSLILSLVESAAERSLDRKPIQTGEESHPYL